ncbi:SSU ribosomal protein S7p (S5e) [hydrothermal vent metagenome]|uniref:SSU ribosomal protein S7p (S5e) n=1 Tax=hydrothermal vent metagenome TaxID=652676 RepID=A0A3B1CSD6_9ZZZZ
MSRRRVTVKREILPDPRFGDRLISKFISLLMRGGKRSIAESICYDAFDQIQEKTGSDPLTVFKAAVDNVKPRVEVKSRRVGGASYQVPVEIHQNRRVTLALRWLTRYARQRSGRTMRDKLAGELLDASTNAGAAVKKREDTHRMADANKAFAHYRW